MKQEKILKETEEHTQRLKLIEKERSEYFRQKQDEERMKKEKAKDLSSKIE